MRLVLDTNVLISALLKHGSVPDRALAAALATAVVLVDQRVLAEYRTVLARPKFRTIDPARLEAILMQIADTAHDVGTAPAWTGALPDDDDRVFVEVALAGQADAIVTGNLRDYPEGLGFEVLPPATVLARLEPLP